MKANRRIKKIPKTRDYSVLKSRLKAFVRYCRLVIVSCIFIGVIGLAGFYGVKTTQQFLNRPVAEIVIESAFEYLTEEEVTYLIEGMLGNSFVGENIDAIKREIESIAWVDKVNLNRQWPDRLIINVDEQAPIARWGNEGFVNIRGELVFTSQVEKLKHLSQLHGDNDYAANIMQQYSLLTTMFQPYDLRITSLQKNHRGVWSLSLDNDWQVMLGRDDVVNKVRRLTTLFDRELLTITANIKVIDIRYENGMAIQWGQSVDADNIATTDLKIKNNSTRVNLEHANKAMQTRG